MLVDTALEGIEEKRGLKLNRKGTRSHDLLMTYVHTLQCYDILRCHIRGRLQVILSENHWMIKRCGHSVIMLTIHGLDVSMYCITMQRYIV